MLSLAQHLRGLFVEGVGPECSVLTAQFTLNH